jgi:HD-GYP domain-containing protein (c-di-GMP phosphodiesterase class II)
MPVLVKVSELEPQMMLANNITNKFSVLLPHGRKLNEYDIRALQRKFPELMVQIVDPVLDEIVDFQDNTRDQQLSQEVRHNIANVAKKVSTIVKSGVDLNADNISGIKEVISNMMEYLQSNQVSMAILGHSDHWNDYLQEHSANVFYLSLLIGNTIRNYIKQERERLSSARAISQGMNLAPLAMAAMFHDIGMVPIDYLYSKKEPLTEQEKELIRAHPAQGARMLPDNIEPMVRQVVRQHHENQDGSGYPEGLPAEKINIFARILRVADAYSAAISTKVFKKAKSPIRVLYEMLYTSCQTLYDPVVLKVFASIVQPLPVGAKLKLSSNQWAVVVRHNRQNPFQPQVIIAYDELGDPLSEDQLDEPFYLGTRDDIEVASFGEEELSFINGIDDMENPEQVMETSGDIMDYLYP